MSLLLVQDLRAKVRHENGIVFCFSSYSSLVKYDEKSFRVGGISILMNIFFHLQECYFLVNSEFLALLYQVQEELLYYSPALAAALALAKSLTLKFFM